MNSIDPKKAIYEIKRPASADRFLSAAFVSALVAAAVRVGPRIRVAIETR